MLYLEDYLEMIEHLPQELRDRFTDMREMDLTVQNNMDSFKKRIRVLFSQCRRGTAQGTQADAEFVAIRKDYYKALEDADEKVQLANQMYDLVDRYLRRLDSELFKFKCELEADHNGITEILEKRSLELDGGASATGHGAHATSQKENRYFGLLTSNNHSQQQPALPLASQGSRDRYSRPRAEKRRDSSSSGPVEKRQAIGSNSNSRSDGGGGSVGGSGGGGGGGSVVGMIGGGNIVSNTIIVPTPALNVRPTTPTVVLPVIAPTIVIPATPSVAPPPVSYSLQHIGAGNAIAAAASQAIAATQQMQQGRRTASLKASYEAIHGSTGNGAHELLIGRELTGAAHNAIQVVTERESIAFNHQRRHKKKMSTSSNFSTSSGTSTIQSALMPASAAALSVSATATVVGAVGGGGVGSCGGGSLGGSGVVVGGVAIGGVSVGGGGGGSNSSSSSVGGNGIAGIGGSGGSQVVVVTTQIHSQQQSPSVLSVDSMPSPMVSDGGLIVEQTPDGEWSYDPNEPRYCVCNQVSYGDMVACDNEACPFEWFHYPCVGITQSPKGKWYCPKCTASMKRRGARK